ncbi:hypothetical protein [Rufibacter soli]
MSSKFIPKKKPTNKQLEFRRKLAHVTKVAHMAQQLIDAGVLKVLPEQKEAYFPANIWETKDEAFKKNLTANLALYLYSLNVQSDNAAKMELELYDFENNALASYVMDQAILYT